MTAPVSVLTLIHLKENGAWEEFPTNQLALGVNTSIPRVNWDVLRLYLHTSSIVVSWRDTRNSKAVLRRYGRTSRAGQTRMIVVTEHTLLELSEGKHTVSRSVQQFMESKF